MTKILFPKEDIVNSIKDAVTILGRMKTNYIEYPQDIVQKKSDYNNQIQAVNIYWIKNLKQSLIEELALIAKLDGIDIFSRRERMALQVKSIRRLHECITKLLFISNKSADERALIFILEYLYALGKLYEYSIPMPRNTIEQDYEKNFLIHKLILEKYKIVHQDIRNYKQLLKQKGRKVFYISDNVHGKDKYQPLSELKLELFDSPAFTPTSLYFQYVLLSEYSHAKGFQSYLIPLLSANLPLLFTHEISLLAIEIFSKYIFHLQNKDVKKWKEEYIGLAKNFVDFSKVSKLVDKNSI